MTNPESRRRTTGVRLSPAEEAELKEAAASIGVPMALLIRHGARSAARAILAGHPVSAVEGVLAGEIDAESVRALRTRYGMQNDLAQLADCAVAEAVMRQLNGRDSE